MPKVNFACFVTCAKSSDRQIQTNLLDMRVPGYDIPCIHFAVHKSDAIELYAECDGLPLPILMASLIEAGLSDIKIFTFGPDPMKNGAPEALARIEYRVGFCGFTGHYGGVPLVFAPWDFNLEVPIPNRLQFNPEKSTLDYVEHDDKQALMYSCKRALLMRMDALR
jgi:hypothetical protein